METSEKLKEETMVLKLKKYYERCAIHVRIKIILILRFKIRLNKSI